MPSAAVARRWFAAGLLRTLRPQLGVITFKLADIGEGIAEVELLKWSIKEGDTIEEMDNVCEVQSDKSAVEISSPYNGKVVKFHHQVGDMVRIGTPLMDVDIHGEDAAAESHPQMSDHGPDQKLKKTDEGPSQQTSEAPAEFSGPAASTPEEEKGGQIVLASPACRVLAKEKGIDLTKVKGTGPGGRVTKEDVLNFQRAVEPEKLPSPRAPAGKETAKKAPTGEEMTEEVMLTSGVAKGMIKSMKASLEVPHMSLQEDIDVTNLFAMRAIMNQHLGSLNPPQKLTVTPFIVKALSQALKHVPIMNSKFNTTSQDRYTLYHNHNVSIAIDTPIGLLVPNIKNVERLSLPEVQVQLLALQELANAGKLTPAHLTGGTISISNVGTVGGTAVRPILFDGQATIIGLGRVQKLPRYNDKTKAFDARDIINVTASVDHRHVDGATVARFMALFRKILENPALLMV